MRLSDNSCSKKRKSWNKDNKINNRAIPKLTINAISREGLSNIKCHVKENITIFVALYHVHSMREPPK